METLKGIIKKENKVVKKKDPHLVFGVMKNLNSYVFIKHKIIILI